MGKIIKNNVVYGGVPDEVITAWETEDVQDLPELTMGDADISDIGDGSITGAIAEHESDISTLNGQVSTLNSKIVIERKSVVLASIGANSPASATIGITKSGYMPVGVVEVFKSGGGNGYMILTSFNINDATSAVISFYNMYSSALSNITVIAGIMYMKN